MYTRDFIAWIVKPFIPKKTLKTENALCITGQLKT